MGQLREFKPGDRTILVSAFNMVGRCGGVPEGTTGTVASLDDAFVRWRPDDAAKRPMSGGEEWCLFPQRLELIGILEYEVSWMQS